jgi:anaerobic selenocysteine-containing dehydrogenase
MSSSTREGSSIVLGTCHHDCPDSCGWEVTVEGGVAVKMRGNAQHPYSQGELCPKVNRFLDRVYSPDRILYPLIRTGAKGAGEFRQATWDEALQLVASKVREVSAEFGGEAVLPWGSAGTQGLIQMNSLDRRFFAKVGSSRQVDSLCGATAMVGSTLTLGSPLANDPMDIEFAQLILLWGTNTRLANRHLWPFIEKARANGAKVVVIDPLRTITAEAADVFIQPLPGTDVALMLALMHILIRDELLDVDYITQYTEGFEELKEQVAQWTPSRAAETCGITVEVIESLAHDYGTIKPAFIRSLIGAEHREHGVMFFRTLTCLPMLTGAWRHKGGGFSRSVGSYAATNVDDSVFDVSSLNAGKERRPLSMNHLGQVLNDATLAPPVKMLFVYNGNPLVTAPNAELIRRGLEREDLFTVVSEQFMTDTAKYADVIFPACTQIEQLDVVPSWGHLYLGWNHQAIQPLGESVANTELWRRLSAACGFTEPELFEDDESLLMSALHDLDVEKLKTDGFVRLSLPVDLLPYANGGFETASGKAMLINHGLPAVGLPPLPTYLAGSEMSSDSSGQAEYPLALMSPKTHVRFINSSYSHLPHHVNPEGEMFCELDPIDALDRGISDGDRVRVFNGRGDLDVVARVAANSGRVRPGLVIVPFGWVGDRTKDNKTVNALTNDLLATYGGGVSFYDTKVQVEKI